MIEKREKLPQEEPKPLPNAREENLCFRCLTPLVDKVLFRGAFYCNSCVKIMEKVYSSETLKGGEI